MNTVAAAWARARRGLGLALRGRSLKRRLVLLFLLMALALAAVFAVGAQRAFAVGWREAARPLLADYLDRLVAEVAPAGGPPEQARAEALVARLPITLRIEGPRLNWDSHPHRGDERHEPWSSREDGRDDLRDGRRAADDSSLLERHTADGHRLRFGIDTAAVQRRSGSFGVALGALLLIVALAYAVVRRWLKPLDDIAAGARRFGAGDFAEPIAVRHPARPDELGQLATAVNTMAEDLRRMLESQRALLLAISHELRSPLTRARLHAELLPEAGEAAPQREALLRDLQEMASLVADLLESERLAGGHAVLQREPCELPALVAEVLQELAARHAGAAAVRVQAAPDLPRGPVDISRLRLLLRNLIDNALRHGAGATEAPELRLCGDGAGGFVITLRDHGPGVADEQLAQLAQPFHRPDSARSRAAGGVGLGLYLSRLVAEAHGGRLVLRQARPGLQVEVTLPAPPSAAAAG